ncbi:terminase large subunit domain-containing protein [Tardiphaga sp. vice304]|uniref:terminase large subunit domain-containing protein n=1 Tax=Tardiphaga sp. vice304 TaxID=2592817 RepID=UPI001FEE1251|nr:terminase family protein [Tardiphaga sp. vice304]
MPKFDASNLPELEKIEAILAAEQSRRLIENRLRSYSPYPKQRAFHAAGKVHRERLFMAGNQLGKTMAGGSEAAMHATGRYPDWWDGATFNEPTVSWVGSPTALTLRDNPQRILLGRVGQHGTGTIPKDAIREVVPARGVADLMDTIIVKWGGGGDTQAADSIIGLKSYEQGREKWQGETLHWLWFDEEPPPAIYTEGLTRTNVTQGPTWLTFTPLLGASEVVRRFLLEKSPDRHITQMTINEAEHYTEEARAKIIASYPVHERDARAKGIPILGSGRIFPVSEDTITVAPFDIPEHWHRIGGMDFGWDHPFAAVELAWDADQDIVYVIKAHRLREATPVVHAGAIRIWGALPWAWPRDGRRETLEGAGVALADQYTAQHLNMLPTHAQFVDGSVSVEAGLMDMLTRMETGKFKVFGTLLDWFEEFRLFHRKDGKVVKEGDDLISATRYAIMMLRFADQIYRKAQPRRRRFFAAGWMGQ